MKENPKENQEKRKIRKLDETVINRIAAGEVIQRPANAIKELMENSLDAGATSIQVTLTQGGLKLLQIQDDGSGINKEDLDIVCERFTTSKLQKYEDLEEIATYGFRGEALASISHIAHVSILTKTADSVCAYKADYLDGKLKVIPGIPNPKPQAGNKGTIITAGDLFYNMDIRKRALKSASDEHNRVVDVVGRYAVHNAKTGFSVKKTGEGNVDLRTPPKSTASENIRIIYGNQISRELLEVTYQDSEFKMSGLVTNVNFSTKKYTFILFINHRLVESTAIRKAIDAVYTSYLPKGSHPFLYLSLEINPRNVDVNVHPTKNEVHFLHEDIIVTSIANHIESLLLGSNQSRTFYVQTLLPGSTSSQSPDNRSSFKTPSSTNGARASSSQKFNNSSSKEFVPLKSTDSMAAQNVYQKNFVRTDPKLQKLDKFLTSTPASQGRNVSLDLGESPASSIREEDGEKEVHYVCSQPGANNDTPGTNQRAGPSTAPVPKKRREIKLRSIKTLLKELEGDCYPRLLSVIRDHIFVGCIDRTRALIQHETRLLMVNTTRLSVELFYQKCLYEFGNFGRMAFEDPVSIRELIETELEEQALSAKRDKVKDKAEGGDKVGTEDKTNDGSETDKSDAESVKENRLDPISLEKEEVPVDKERVSKIYSLLMSKANMLDDYFSIKFDTQGRIRTLPLLIDNYFPPMDNLGKYLVSLAEKVDWTNEKNCFSSFAFQTAVFYSIPAGSKDDNKLPTLNNRTWSWTIEHLIYPEAKKCLLPPKIFFEEHVFVQLANLPDLYKVFERC